ncbi:MAG TPA: hypothetical protein VL689_10270 [Paraburkholderia sp.]|jgi:hypothetical protein|nr:hypothetical protein [Paraburkholderia sp.]
MKAIYRLALLPPAPNVVGAFCSRSDTRFVSGIPPSLAWLAGALAMTAYVAVSGMHGCPPTAIVNDTLVLVVCVLLGVCLPVLDPGSPRNVIGASVARMAAATTLAASGSFVSARIRRAHGHTPIHPPQPPTHPGYAQRFKCAKTRRRTSMAPARSTYRRRRHHPEPSGRRPVDC